MGLNEQEISITRAIYLATYPGMDRVFDNTLRRGGKGDTSESQAMWDKSVAAARAAINVLPTSDNLRAALQTIADKGQTGEWTLPSSFYNFAICALKN